MAKLQTIRKNPERDRKAKAPETPKVVRRMTRAATEKDKLTRSFKIERAKVNKDERTCEMAFSSEEPVERWNGMEVLSHAEGEYDFSRLNSDHPLLLGHDEWNPASQIGVVVPGTAKVGNDGVARCTVRFSKGPLGDEIFQDVQDGIRTQVSVGYDHTGIVKQDKAADGMVTTRYKWMPTHVAIVPVPADYKKAGVGRAADPKTEPAIDFEKLSDSEIQNLPKPQIERMKRILLSPTATEGGAATATATPPATATQSPADALKAERARVKEITAIAEALTKDHPQAREKIREITNEAIAAETSKGDYQIRAMEEVLKAKPVKPETMEAWGVSEEQRGKYSILRGIQSMLRNNKGRPDGFEGEMHDHLIKRMAGTPVDFQGYAVPHDAPCRTTSGRSRAERRRLRRDLQVSVSSQGGVTVQTTVQTPIIELLRNRLVTSALGVTSLSGLSSNVAIPRQTGAATAYALAESATLTKSTQALDQILLAPHRVGAWNDYTRQFLLQSEIDPENFIRDDLMKVLAIKWDFLILNGQGAGSEPLGILNTPGIGSVLFGGTATYGKVVDFETALAVLNADQGMMAYATTPSVRGAWKKIAAALTGATAVINGSQNAIWAPGEESGEGDVNGYLGLASNQIPNNQVIFGNWPEAVHGLYGGFDIIVNPYSRDTDAAVRVTINSFGDVALRHAVSFCASADAGNQ